jgi:hypothetical protein
MPATNTNFLQIRDIAITLKLGLNLNYIFIKRIPQTPVPVILLGWESEMKTSRNNRLHNRLQVQRQAILHTHIL